MSAGSPVSRRGYRRISSSSASGTPRRSSPNDPTPRSAMGVWIAA
ncbi:hypothetical protein [Sorangium cellulosum]|nr:hypothetical protein [Sorangium cellulosum]